jgi:uncharacterized protein YjiS (DUF1127 family)
MDPTTTGDNGLRTLLQRLQRWWQESGELRALDPGELSRLAGELGLTAGQLQDLVAQGPGGAELLQKRLNVLGLSRADIERIGAGVARDLERTCGCCGDKSICREDLERHPNDSKWKEYCPNAMALEGVRRTKGRFPV